jgi:hypothetical protein
MNKGKEIFFVLVALFILAIMFSSKSDYSYAADFNVSVDVNISAYTEITVSPAFLNWTNIIPGTAGGIKYVDIRNTGSTNITNLYSFITTLENETARPYGSSNPDSYSAGGVVVVRNESLDKYWWAGRLEWNWTQTISNTDQSDIPASSRAAEGFFRNASVSYYWAAGNGTAGLCSGSGSIFALEDDADTGAVSTRTPTASSISRDGGDSEYSYFSISRGTNFLNGACIAVSSNCQKIYMYKFDRRTGAFNGSTCANSVYMNNAQMAPNEIENIAADVWVPKGIPQGNLRRATWTFVAS